MTNRNNSVIIELRITPCKNCPERSLGCHTRCPKYLDWKKEVDALREREKSDIIVQSTILIREGETYGNE